MVRSQIGLPAAQYYLLSDLKGLKILTTGGSASSKEVLDKARSNNEHYINLYGPTECTVISTYWESNDEHDELIPIGKPISNAKGYVMQDGKLCGIGIPGELCISGPGVSRGYLNREELTKKQFTPNPFGPGNIYHTGDLVRWNSDGDIEYLGRIDEQVKVRGYRIELGEVGSAIRRCEDVTDCAVIIRDGADGQAALFAYFVSPKTIDIVDIHRQLSDVLPKYMIPSYIMQLDRIPINSSGKIDKRRLPDISNIVTEAYAAPEEKREIILCQAFEEILGVEKVGIHDNFFNLGGDSIKAIRIVSQVREMGYRLTTKKIMEACIVSKIALEMERDDAVVYDQDAVVGEVTSLPIVKMFKKWELPVPGHFNQSTMLKFVDDCQVVIIESLKILVGHHDMLRAVYQNDKLVIRPTTAANLLEFETFIFTSDITDDQIRGLCDRIQSEIDIENGPLVHCGYFATKSGYYLLISAHHLIVDNISWHIILEDLNHIINRLKGGQHPELPKKTASYKSWCNLYEEFAATESCKEQEAFWQDQVSQIVDGNLKADLNLSGQGFASKTVSFDEDVTEKFLHQSNQAYNTESMDILLAALGKAVNNISSTEKVAVWLEGHGRHELHMHIDVDRTVGWFTNCYPLILKNYASLEDQVIGIKELVHDIPMKGIGYGAFVDNFEDFVYPSISLNYLGEIVSNDKFDVNLASLTGRDIAEENGYITDIVFNGKVADGNLQFDVFYNQKLNGFRIELDEINAALTAVESISEAVTCIKQSSDGVKHIVAYVVSDEKVDTGAIKKALVSELPRYMIPAFVVQVEKMPLNENGKIDKSALPEVDMNVHKDYVKPVNKIQRELCEIIEGVLAQKKIGITDNIYELGCDSIISMKLLTKMKQLGYVLTISDLYAYPTVKEMSDLLQQKSEIEEADNEEGNCIFEEMDDVISYLKSELKSYNDAVLSNRVIKKGKLTACQKRMRGKLILMSGTAIKFDNEFSINKVRECIRRVFERQEIFRYGLRRNKIIVHDYLDEYNIPYLNLKNAPDSLKDEVKAYMSGEFFRLTSEIDNKEILLHRIAAVKYSSQECYLYLPISHLIFDAMSGELLYSEIMRNYNTKNTQNTEEVSCFTDYVKQLEKGPKNLGTKEIMDRLQIKEYSNSIVELGKNDTKKLENYYLN